MFRIARRAVLSLALVAPLPALAQTTTPTTPHNLILFVPDGLRAAMVDASHAPAMAALRDAGVNFANPHSLFPTFTTANASAMATGHYLGDTGDFSNTIYAGFPVAAAGGSGHAVSRKRPGHRRARRPFRRQLPERGSPA